MTTLTAARKRATLELVANFLDNMSDALDHIDSEMTYTDANVYPTSTSLAAQTVTDANGRTITVGSSGGHGKGGTVSPVERRVIDAQDRLRTHRQNLWDAFTCIVATAHDGSHQATAASKRIVPGFAQMRCNRGAGKRLDGHTVWQNPECENFPGLEPVIEGMCDDCLHLCNTWRRENGLDPIARDVEALNYRHTARGERGRFSAA